MPLQHVKCPGAELDAAILAGLRTVLVARHDASLCDADLALDEIAVRHPQGNLLRWTQTGEESELIVVALGLAPVAMDRRNKRFGLLDREGIDYRPIFLRDAKAFESGGGIVLLRMVPIAVLKCGSQRTSNVVVGLLADSPRVGDLYQGRVLDVLEVLRTDRGTPNRIKDFAVAVEGRECEVILLHA